MRNLSLVSTFAALSITAACATTPATGDGTDTAGVDNAIGAAGSDAGSADQGSASGSDTGGGDGFGTDLRCPAFGACE